MVSQTQCDVNTCSSTNNPKCKQLNKLLNLHSTCRDPNPLSIPNNNNNLNPRSTLKVEKVSIPSLLSIPTLRLVLSRHSRRLIASPLNQLLVPSKRLNPPSQ